MQEVFGTKAQERQTFRETLPQTFSKNPKEDQSSRGDVFDLGNMVKNTCCRSNTLKVK
jgi:hypothetical protein